MIRKANAALKPLVFLFALPLLSVVADTSWPMEIQSPAFHNDGNMPRSHTCDGTDLSPPLAWQKVPSQTATFALVVDDPDAPAGSWVHWVLYNLPGSTRELAAGTVKSETLPNGAKQGINDFGNIGYAGPCPPPGPAHRYFFKLYALNTQMTLQPRATRQQLLDAVKGHIIDSAEIVARYRR